MFDGFTRETVTTAGGAIHLVRGGAGPPVLPLHGYPQTHAAWHRVARREDEGGPVPAGTPRATRWREMPYCRVRTDGLSL